jgi:hypothetical protein
MLCALCESFFLSGPVARHTRNESSRYHPSVEALEAAANAGCVFCVKVQAARLIDRDGGMLYGYDPKLARAAAMASEANGGQVKGSLFDNLSSFPSSPTWWVDTVDKSGRPRCIAVAGPPIASSASLRPILITFKMVGE